MMSIMAWLALFLNILVFARAYELAWKTLVGCPHWGPGCWIPGFRGTDSSPSFFAVNGTKDGAITIGSYNSNVYGVSAADGKVLYKTTSAGGEGSPVVAESLDSIMSWGVLTGKTLDCLNASTGTILWKWSPPCGGSIVTSGPFDSELGFVFAGTSSTHQFYAVNASNGATIWNVSTGGEMWGTLGALLVKDMVCVGAGGSAIPTLDCKAAVVCMKRATGKILWRARAGKQIQSRPSFSLKLSLLFVGDYDGCIYAMDLETGVRRWKSCTGREIEGSTLVVNDLVLAPSYDGQLHAVRANDGKSVWNVTLGKGPIASTPCLSKDGRMVYIGGQDGLHCIDAQKGTEQWKLYTGALVGSSPALNADETLLTFGCENGYLYGLSPNALVV